MEDTSQEKGRLAPIEGGTINECNSAFQFENSDIVVVSSDDLEFKLHTWILRSCSKVFQDTLNIDPKKDPDDFTNI
ncbi:hypothetical protein V865_006430 [Kwoniella europaea PYCC6329]|uniref:BTB domain-containing protein n=1 Tax=Kwoniella europaea PYCC6329 TaxID=1423913 RepID=A0AAX4KQT6_9TREE